jgi:hypothetical protein
VNPLHFDAYWMLLAAGADRPMRLAALWRFFCPPSPATEVFRVGLRRWYVRGPRFPA